MTIRTMVIDISDYRRQSLVACFSRRRMGVSVVAEGRDLIEIEAQLLSSESVDVLIINIDEKRFLNPRIWMEIRVTFPSSRILAITQGDDQTIEAAFSAGVASLHPFDAGCERLCQATRNAYRGEVDCHPDFLNRARHILLRPTDENLIQLGGLTIKPESREVTRWGTRVPLSPMEFDFVLYLAKKRGAPASSDELLRAIWGVSGETGGTTAQVKNLALRIRKKLEPVPNQPRYLISHRGWGYLLNNPLGT